MLIKLIKQILKIKIVKKKLIIYFFLNIKYIKI
jgi:hypothetical protein